MHTHKTGKADCVFLHKTHISFIALFHRIMDCLPKTHCETQWKCSYYPSSLIATQIYVHGRICSSYFTDLRKSALTRDKQDFCKSSRNKKGDF